MVKPLRLRILGGSGSGKTSFARHLGQRYSLPVLHLDDIYWMRGWVERDVPEFRKKVASFIDNHDNWIMEGNYTKIKDTTFAKATHCIISHPPLPVNLWRLFWRELVRRSSYKFLSVTPPPRPTIGSKYDMPLYRSTMLLMKHATRYYRTRVHEWVTDLQQNFPNVKVYIKQSY